MIFYPEAWGTSILIIVTLAFAVFATVLLVRWQRRRR